MDMYETKDDLVVTCELPGVEEKQVPVSERSLSLPMPVQTDKVKATYRDGVLEIKLPKAEAVKPKEIKIDIL